MLAKILFFALGFIVGTICTTILLCKKNLEMYKQIEKNASNTLSNNMAVAKAVYKNAIDEYENGAAENSEDFSDSEKQ